MSGKFEIILYLAIGVVCFMVNAIIVDQIINKSNYYGKFEYVYMIMAVIAFSIVGSICFTAMAGLVGKS